MYAFATTRATAGLSPWLVHVAGDAGMNASRREFPNVRTLQLCADANASCAQNATIVIEHKSRMRHVDRELWIVVGQSNSADPKCAGHRLKLAMAVRNADRANVISLDQQEFQRDPSITRQFGRVGRHRHPFLNWRRTRREQALGTGDFHQANPAGTN